MYIQIYTSIYIKLILYPLINEVWFDLCELRLPDHNRLSYHCFGVYRQSWTLLGLSF